MCGLSVPEKGRCPGPRPRRDGGVPPLINPRIESRFPHKRMKALKVALTGGIACGKSMAERAFAACGCRVLDADAAVRRVAGPGGAAVGPIAARFGAGVVGPDGGVESLLPRGRRGR